MKAEFYSEVENYLNNRINDSTSYRGMHLAQHNRLPIEKLLIILRSIRIAVESEWFIEPASDDPAPTRKHDPLEPRRIPLGMTAQDCEEYYLILDEIYNARVEKVTATFNSLKKNIFPNLEGMGLLERDDSGQRSGGNKKARLTPVAIDFLDGTDRTQKKIFSECNERILKPIVEILDVVLEKFDTVNVYEMMLFLTDESINIDRKIELISKYKSMKKLQVIQLHDSLQTRMNKSMGTEVAKIDKLDWHNWWNESRQMTDMLETVVGFNVYQDEQIMKAGNAEAIVFSASRSQNVRREALAWHGLASRDGWDLHHILPVEYATSSSDLKQIDDKRNLLYIPSSIHRGIPNTSNRMVQLTYDATHVVLKNPLSVDGKPLKEIAWPVDAGVDHRNLEEMVSYNTKLLELVIA
jgi:hypothetical protein